MNDFWVLGEPNPDSRDANRRRAKWNTKVDLQYESIRCAINPEHRRAGTRITPLNVTITDIVPYDFLWAYFDCLIQEHVANFFLAAGFTGYETAPATVHFVKDSKPAPRFHELIVRGSAGLLSAESGYSALGICPGCGLIDNKSKVADPSKVVNRSSWDGTDFFQIKPITGLIFVTDRVVQELKRNHFTGWKANSPSEMENVFDIMLPVSPRSRSHMN